MLIRDFRIIACEQCGRLSQAFYCNELQIRNEADTQSETLIICAKCYTKLPTDSCSDCNVIFRTNSSKSLANTCKSCKSTYLHRDIIRSARSNPLNLVDKLADQLLTGIELEIEVPDGNYTDKAEEVLQLIGKDYAIAKEDGSVDGFELVTIPGSLNQHKKRFEWLKENKPRGLKGWSGRNNGLHIHMSRKYINPTTLVKLLQFVYSKYNREFMYAVAGRKSDDYASLTLFDHGSQSASRWIYKQKWEKKLETVRNNSWINPCNGERYVGVNLLNKHTIEFRIFRSTLNYDRLISILEFLYALVNWVQTQKLTDELKYEDFVAWTEVSQYKFLKKFFKEKKHLATDYRTRVRERDDEDDYDDEYDRDESDESNWCEGCQDYH